jgi:hypothetical protein
MLDFLGAGCASHSAILDFGFGTGRISSFQNRKSKIQNRLGCFDDLARFQAARADANPLGATADQRAHRLQVGIEAAIRTVIRVTDAMTELRPLAANIAPF